MTAAGASLYSPGLPLKRNKNAQNSKRSESRPSECTSFDGVDGTVFNYPFITAIASLSLGLDVAHMP